MNITKITEEHCLKYVELSLPVGELIMIQNLLADVCQGMLPSSHFDEYHQSFYHAFFHFIDHKIGEVLKE